MPLMNVIFGRLVNGFNSYFTPGVQPTLAEFNHLLNRQSLYIFILFLARFFLNYVSKFSFRLIGIRMSAKIRLEYLRCLFGQTVHVLDSMPSGAAAGVITKSANTLQLGISEKLGTFVEYTATIVSAIIIAYTFSWQLALATSSLLLFILISVAILLPGIIRLHTRMTLAEERASSVANEVFSSIRMVTACGAESRVMERFAKWTNETKRYGLQVVPLMALQFGIIVSLHYYSTRCLSRTYGD
jgi:ABC-type multidrug transport system fused ATPase/permease subunit